MINPKVDYNCPIRFSSSPFQMDVLSNALQRFFSSSTSSSFSLSAPQTKQIHSISSPATPLLKLQTLKFAASLVTSSGSEQNKITMEQSKGPEAEAAAAASKGLSDDILPYILNLYSSPAARDFEIYAPNATFEDPLMSGHGVKQIKSAFYSIPKVFSESRITEYTLQENLVEPGKGEILIDNKQHYKFLGKDVTMISLIKLQVENGKVVRHEDWWDKKPLRNRDTVKLPLLGRVIETTRRGSMFLTHALMRFGKDPTP